MQPVLVDLDGTAGFLYVVRIRGVLCEAAHPDRVNMRILERRVQRANCPDEASLRAAVRDHVFKLLDVLFEKSTGWKSIRHGILDDEPISPNDATIILLQYLTLVATVRGEDLTPYVDGSFSLIAEDDGVTKARAKLAASLPPGRVIGAPAAPINTEPQQGVADDAS